MRVEVCLDSQRNGSITEANKDFRQDEQIGCFMLESEEERRHQDGYIAGLANAVELQS